eukprot:6840452-Pyramimonas_sp.AAC.2
MMMTPWVAVRRHITQFAAINDLASSSTQVQPKAREAQRRCGRSARRCFGLAERAWKSHHRRRSVGHRRCTESFHGSGQAASQLDCASELEFHDGHARRKWQPLPHADTMINNTMGLLTGILPNRDGVLIIDTLDGLGNKARPTTFMRALCTDSGHYLFPIDDPDAGAGSERVRLRQAVKAYFDKVFDEDIPRSSTLTQETARMTSVDSEREAPAPGKSIHVLDSRGAKPSGKMETAPQRAYVPDAHGGAYSGSIVTMSQPGAGARNGETNHDEEAQTSESRMRVRKETAFNSKSDAYAPYLDSKDYYRRWRQWKAPRWTGANLWPRTMDTNTARSLESNYRAMPEEFYFETRLPVVTPEPRRLDGPHEHLPR